MSFQSLERHVRRFSNHWKSLAITVAISMPFIGGAQSNAPETPVEATKAPVADETQDYVLGPTNVLAEQLFAFVSSAEIAGTITDDALVAAVQTATISGTISNDLWLAAVQSAEVSGSVGDHARVAAAVVNASGRFGRSLAAIGQRVDVGTNAVVSEDAYLAGSSVTAEGLVGSNLYVQAVSATIGGDIRGTVHVTATDISVLPNTRIGGDLVYTTEKELFLDKSVAVGGKLTHEKPPSLSVLDVLASQFGNSLYYWFGAMMTGTLFVFLFPRFAGGGVRLLRHATWRCIFTGAFVSMLLLIVSTFAIMTFVAAPFGATLMASLALMAYLGNSIVALALGGVLMRQRGPQPIGSVLLTLAIGLAVLYAAKALPLNIGFMVALTGWFAGTGALLLNMLHAQRIIVPQQPPPLPGGGDRAERPVS